MIEADDANNMAQQENMLMSGKTSWNRIEFATPQSGKDDSRCPHLGLWGVAWHTVIHSMLGSPCQEHAESYNLHVIISTEIPKEKLKGKHKQQ